MQLSQESITKLLKKTYIEVFVLDLFIDHRFQKKKKKKSSTLGIERKRKIQNYNFIFRHSVYRLFERGKIELHPIL